MFFTSSLRCFVFGSSTAQRFPSVVSALRFSGVSRAHHTAYGVELSRIKSLRVKSFLQHQSFVFTFVENANRDVLPYNVINSSLMTQAANLIMTGDYLINDRSRRGMLNQPVFVSRTVKYVRKHRFFSSPLFFFFCDNVLKKNLQVNSSIFSRIYVPTLRTYRRWFITRIMFTTFLQILPTFRVHPHLEQNNGKYVTQIR